MREELSAARLRMMAGKCRAMARSTDDPRAIDSLLKLAAEYEVAAKTAEQMSLPQEARRKRG